MLQSTIMRRPSPTRRKRSAFTLIEIMIVVIIAAIASVISVDYISHYIAATRPGNAARECLIAFRYARQLAMNTGKSTKVTFNTTTNAFSVYWMSNGSTWDTTPVAQPAGQGGTYTVTMNNTTELSGVTISLSPSGTTAFTYNARGNLDNTTVITFTCGSNTNTLTVSQVGDPVIN